MVENKGHFQIPRSKFSSQVTKDGGWVAPSNGTSPRVALMELVNIAYEDAEKNGGSMTFEKPLGASGFWTVGAIDLVLISPGKSCILFESWRWWWYFIILLTEYVRHFVALYWFRGSLTGYPMVPQEMFMTAWWWTGHWMILFRIYIYIYTSPCQELPVCTFYCYLFTPKSHTLNHHLSPFFSTGPCVNG